LRYPSRSFVKKPPVSPRLLAPNLVTASNIAFGFASMLHAAAGHYDLAVRLLLVSILLDMADGIVARLLRATSKFGQELDSFSDALSFGAAPAFLVYQALLQPLGGVGVALAVVYLLCGVLRLARFNLTNSEHEKSARTVGVPIPVAASYLMALVLMRDEVPAAAAGLVVLAAAALMVSRVALPQLKRRGPLPAMLMVGLATYLVVVFAPSWRTVLCWNLWNAAILLVAVGERRALAGEDQDEELASSLP
jgi:CDP-diacylglycerol--serine O-phosphatidyltransferase